MTRWSLSIFPFLLSRQRFLNLTMQLKRAAELSFETPCKIRIEALKAIKLETTFPDEIAHEHLESINRRKRILDTESLHKVTPSLWRRARYIEATIRPVDPAKAPPYAFASIEAKGRRPCAATFYIQPDGQDARMRMLSKNRLWAGDGFSSHAMR